MKFLAEHTVWTIELWTILAIIGLILLLVFIIWKHRKIKKKYDQMNKILQDEMGGDDPEGSATPSV